MASPLIVLIKLLFNPDVSKKMILQMAFQQIKAIGVAKVVAAALGLLTVAASSVVKVPQIMKILAPQSVEGRSKLSSGLSIEGLSLEAISQLIHIVYNSQANNAFINYGELLLIGVQNVALILLIEYYRLRGVLAETSNMSDKDQIEASLKELKRPVAAIVGVVVFLTKIAPTQLVDILQVLNIPLSIASKLPQIRNNHVLKSTAHLSAITVIANTIGLAIRVFTTVKGSRRALRLSDYVLLAGYLTGFVLNATLLGQIYHYRPKETLEEKKLE